MTKSVSMREDYMCNLFPWMMSFVPGGIRYDLNKPMIVRIQSWIFAHNTLAAVRDEAKLALHGANACESTNHHDAMDTAIELAMSTQLRKVRNKWKRLMKENNWDCGDHLWRREDGRDADVWADEWIAFREALAYHIN